MQADWKRICDKIYCIGRRPYAEFDGQARLSFEQAGITGSGLLDWRCFDDGIYECAFRDLTASGRLRKFSSMRPMRGGFPDEAAFCDAVHQMKILQEIAESGRGRALVVEDGVVFMKDKDMLAEIIADTPEGYDIVDFDCRFAAMDRGATYETLLRNNAVNANFIDIGGVETAGATCMLVTAKAARAMLDAKMRRMTCRDYSATSLKGLRIAAPAVNCAVHGWNPDTGEGQDEARTIYAMSHRLDIALYDSCKACAEARPAAVAAAAVCATRSENIDEWIRHYVKLGFDSIYVYDLTGRAAGEQRYGRRVHVVDFRNSGPDAERLAYMRFAEKHVYGYDWAAFVKDDEFLNLRTADSIQTFLSARAGFHSVSINVARTGAGCVGRETSTIYNMKKMREDCRGSIDPAVFAGGKWPAGVRWKCADALGNEYGQVQAKTPLIPYIKYRSKIFEEAYIDRRGKGAG